MTVVEPGAVSSDVVAWPSARMPVPAVFRPCIRELDDEVLVLETPSASTGTLIDVPEEFFLRELLDLDIGDAHAIADFTREFGLLLFSRARPVGARGAEHVFWSPHRDLEELRRSLAQELRDFARSSGRDTRSVAEDPQMLPLVAVLRSVHAQVAGEYPDGVMALHVDDFRLLAAEYRDLVRIWLDIQTGGDEHRAAWESPHLAPPDDPVDLLASRLSSDLRHFAPRVLVARSGMRVPESDHTWSLNRAVAAQIYNDVVSRPVYRRCALEDCRRFFARARGRSEQGRHRSDARYCSKACADLAMKRRQRARERLVR